MDAHPNWRLRVRAALEAYFRDRSYPRFALTLLVTIAGFVGFFISHTLLNYGFEDMWLRYPISVIGGYLAFLALLRFWVEIERARFDPKKVRISTELPDESTSPLPKTFTGDNISWLDWLDLSEFLNDGEGCVIGCLFVLVIGLVAGMVSILFSIIMAAPELMAEMFLDAVVMTLFYRHLKNAAKEHWLGTAVKRTWKSALLTAAALSLLGLLLGGLAPDRHSIRPALKEISTGIFGNHKE